MIRNLTICGMGLIGSSLACAVRTKGLVQRITALEKTPDLCKEVIGLDLADAAFTDPARAVSGADIVILCTPVGQMGALAAAIGPHLAHGAIVSDVGSVKQAVVEAVRPHMPPYATFVPGHPVAGTEKSGPSAGFAQLFEGRWTILTPGADTPLRAVEAITKLWEAVGARIAIMDPAHHDLTLAITSHLPQLIAYTIVGTATDLASDLQEEVIRYSAGGFRDFTRIAASDPTMWRDIFLANKEATLQILQRFTEDLTAAQRAIRHDDGEYLFKTFSRTRDIKRRITQAGQDIPEEDKKRH